MPLMRNGRNQTPSDRTMRLIPAPQKSNDYKTYGDTGNADNPLGTHSYGNMSVFVKISETTR